MKHYLAYKKQFKISLLVALVLTPFVFSYAQTVSDLQGKISNSNTEISKLEEEIKTYQKQLETLGTQKSTLNNSIKQLDVTRQKLTTNIKVTQNKIGSTNLEIGNIASDISSKEEKISANQKAISQGLREINDNDHKNLIETILSQDNLSDAWNEIEQVKTIQTNLRGKIQELNGIKADLELNKNEAEVVKQKMVLLKGELDDQKKINDQNTLEKNKLLKDTKNKETNYNKILQDKIAKKTAFEKDVRDYESQLKFILDPSTLPKSGSAVFSWPLSDILITQMFGATVDAKRLYVSGSHNGIDFRASIGTPVMAMANGIVVGTGNTDTTCPAASYGKWVFIKYSNGLSSIYGHLSLIKVTEGESIKVGQVVGYSGNTGYSTGPHLHLGVYASSAVKVASLPSKACGGRTYTMPIAPINAYLDPMLYLPSYNH